MLQSGATQGCQKRPTSVSKETYYRVKRDLLATTRCYTCVLQTVPTKRRLAYKRGPTKRRLALLRDANSSSCRSSSKYARPSSVLYLIFVIHLFL